MTLKRPGSPLLRWYLRAILSAVSTASEPPLVKSTREFGSGARAATRSASSIVAGFTVPSGA